ncbi:hypothetical protein CIK06_25620 [Plantactinospora sp. KBS50]|nr:hypothetical protein CIK06_25620 [Plantactinospora sp. KBS50]
MALILAAAAAVPTMAGCEEKAKSGPEQSESRSFNLSGTTLKVVATEAAVQIKAGAGGGIDVKRSVRGEIADGDSAMSLDDGTLHLRATCGGVVKDCSAKYTVTVPKGVSLNLDGVGSDVTVTGLRNGLTARLSADASLSANDIAGTMQLRSDGGDITVKRARADTVKAVASNDGNVRLSFAEPPRSVEAKSYGGAVTVVVPTGSATYRVVTAGNSVGKQLESDPRSSRTISAVATDGPVSVRKG